MASNQYDVIVVGSGAGGLGASMTLAKAGMSTLLLEKHSQVGGYITSFKRKGFSFDPGAAILSGNSINMALDMVEMRQRVSLDLMKVEGPGIGLHSPQFHIKSAPGLTTSQLMAQFSGLKPDEASEIEKTIDKAKTLMMDPEMQKVPMLDWLNENFTNPMPPLIFGMLGFLALILPPSKVPAGMTAIISLLSMDLCYPKGGVISIANAYAEAFKLLGGELRTKTTVSKILTKGQRVEGVELNNGERLQSKIVISNVGLGNTVKLVGADLLEKELVDKITKLKPTLSCFSVFLGLDYIPDIVPHTFSVTSGDVNELESVYKHLSSGKFYENENDPMPLYIHTPSLEDPGLAPPGQTSMTTFVYAPYELAEGNWKDKKEYYTERIIGAMEKRLLPGLSRKIVYKEAATPVTYERFVGKQGGAVLGYELSLDQSPIAGDIMPIEGLHCVGDTVAGSLAVPGSIMGGARCAQEIIESRSTS